MKSRYVCLPCLLRHGRLNDGTRRTWNGISAQLKKSYQTDSISRRQKRTITSFVRLQSFNQAKQQDDQNANTMFGLDPILTHATRTEGAHPSPDEVPVPEEEQPEPTEAPATSDVEDKDLDRIPSSGRRTKIPKLDQKHSRILSSGDTTLQPIDMGEIDVPRLTYDLSRVLFNPGVYQLQDPRSRVYNFDPYLQNIMPVNEFNFDILNEYVTSSKDQALRDIAVKEGKRYIGSSSSMSSVLSHFHFLLSSWRDINVDSLSKAFKVENLSFTKIHKAPAAIFLHWKDGVYAVDADKEFDSSNILMNLGKSMEKLVTLEKDEYERYRKSKENDQHELEVEPEQYHYGGLGKFLLRSQLDAYDPRLPGTGMFDLKTRAVVSIRMILSDYERGLGYQIKDRQGTWESYEREYYDMIRSAFLKYSLQARMGRMDGIFVTYHNVQSIFGFQYIALPELDLALHGQTDPSLGDQEFGHSVQIMSALFDRVTAIHPKQSIRFHFDTRQSEAKIKEQIHRMYIFAEPMSEDEIVQIQQSNAEQVAALETKFRNGMTSRIRDETEAEEADDASSPTAQRKVIQERFPPRQDNAANVDFLNSLGDLNLDAASEAPESTPVAIDENLGSKPQNPVLGFELVVKSALNGKSVIRPANINAKDKWLLDYDLTLMPDEQARSKYNLCKMRRKNALRDMQDDNIDASSYHQQLLKFSRDGAKWRQEQDVLDAQKQRVVLYT